MNSKTKRKLATAYDAKENIAQAVIRGRRSGDIAEACNWLRSRHGRRRNPPLEDVLFEVAYAFSRSHPADTLTIVEDILSLAPRHVPSFLLAAGLQDQLGKKNAALTSCLKVIESPDATNRQVLIAANLLIRLEDSPRGYEAAVSAYERAGRPVDLCPALLYIAQRCADFQLSERLVAQLREAYTSGDYLSPAEPPRQNLLWCPDLATNIRVTQEWSRSQLRVTGGISVPSVLPLNGRRIRVGYLSSDFRDHPTSRLANGLIKNHDRDRFELFMYCSGWDDGSAMRKEIEARFDHVFSVATLSDFDAAGLIRSHGVDVLVELNGPTRAHRMGVFCHRPAPVQIDYLGWPGSVGGRVVDYVIGDEYTVRAGEEKLYPERVIRVSKTYQVNDHGSFKPLREAPSRTSLNLPEGVPVMGMFNAINKTSGEVWAAWMEILRNVPEAVLWILNPGDVARRHLASATKAEGISVRRVIAAPYVNNQQHLERLQVCDLMVDPWPYGGHTSTTDAVFAGVPVVAMAGQNFAGRVSGGLLRAAGLETFIRKGVADYIEFATDLLRDKVKLAEARRCVRERAPDSALFDAKRLTRELERAYGLALQRAIDGLPPVHMNFQVPLPESVDSIPNHAVAAIHPGRLTGSRSDSGRAVQENRQRVFLVCGPWGSGTSAVASLLAALGLAAPGPYVRVNDPRTRETFEMLDFRAALRAVASEPELRQTADDNEVLQALYTFADGPLAAARQGAGLRDDQPVILKHGLAALLLPQLETVFDLRIVGVLRPLEDIEATRRRRGWQAHLGAVGAGIIYDKLFSHLLRSSAPFHLVRFADVRADADRVIDDLARFCGVVLDDAGRLAASQAVASESVMAGK